MSRTTNSLRNAGTAMAGQLLNNLLRFACRTAFLYTLGEEFLGISSLYSNVLTILNISELGLSTAITYSLYKPLAKDDREAIRSLMTFYKKAYRAVGFVVLALGLALMPFLPRLMTGVTDKVNIYHYYLLYLTQTVVSYLFFAYKSALLIADQKKYLVDLIHFTCQIAVAVAQIVVLLVLRSFFVYTVLAICGSAAQNVVTAVLAQKRYPYIRGQAKPLDKAVKKDLFSRVYALALQKISTAVGNATDNLIIAAYISVTAVGRYDNYHMIVAIIQNAVGGVFRAMTASLGNLFASEDRQRSEFVFRSLNILNSWVVATCSVCFLSLFQPFVTLWAGEKYLLDFSVVAVIVLNFATNYMQNVVLIFRDASGLFVRGKYRSVANAAMNLILSLILVRHWGLTGVFMGSIISRLVTNWWYDAWILYRHGFGKRPWWYYGSCLLTIVLAALCFGAVMLLCGGLSSGWICIMVRLAASVGITAVVYGLLYGRTAEFRFLRDRVLGILRRT